jgi:hypothetical protein
MAHKVNICYAILETDSAKISAMELRGYLGYLFVNDSEFHHHSESSYHYPLIQYKKIDHKLIIIGFVNYANCLFSKISQLEYIITPNRKIPIQNIHLENKTFLIEEKQCQYRFVTPWIALNSTNYAKYMEMQGTMRKEFLSKILVGNILSMLKGFGISYEKRIIVTLDKIKTIVTKAHENQFAGFYCSWNSNISLPNYIGLGKSVSKGFGVLGNLS